MSVTDFTQRFVFDKVDARGCYVRLQDTLADVQATHHYPDHIAQLLNEFALAAVLLRDSIKLDGSVTIQLRTSGAINLMMADCMADRRVRAIAEYDSELLAPAQSLLLNDLGDGAVLAITITPIEGDRYQSVVPIEHETLADCLEDYFQRSEQLPTWFSLHASREVGVGIAIHALPSQLEPNHDARTENFSRLKSLLNTLGLSEALELDSQPLLSRLFHQENCRLFDAKPTEFGCVCSQEKSLNALRSLGQQALLDLIDEQRKDGHDKLTVDCHFCFQRYQFEFDPFEGLIK